MKSFRQAFYEGRRVCRSENGTAADCPYTPGQPEFTAWNAGYAFQYWMD